MSSAAPALGRVSPLDAAQDAVEHTRRQLFPFRFERWLALGFLAFLDQCGRGGWGAPNTGGVGDGGPHGPDMSAAADWLSSHVALVVVVTAAALTLVVLLAALVLWLGSRGVFMYLDAVATGRADVSRPWREHAERAHSLFAWRFALALAGLLGVFVLLLALAALVFSAARGRLDPSVALLVGLAGLLPAFLGLAIAGGFLSFLLWDFAAPIQLAAGVSCGRALRLSLDLARAHLGPFALYALLKIVFSLALGITLLLACCLTCCVGMLPVVAQTLLQPAFYFERAWSLFFLRQMGYDVLALPVSELRRMPEAPPEPWEPPPLDAA